MFKAKIGNSINYPTGELEQHFQTFSRHIIGHHHLFHSPYGMKKIIYADWTASGRLYRPIETKLTNLFGPFIGNTHTESTVTGTTTTEAYHYAKEIIKSHVHAHDSDILISAGTGMTAAVTKLQRLLGIRAPQNIQNQIHLKEEDRPIIFVSHMEHHSNYLSWQETIGDVVMLPPGSDGSIDIDELQSLLYQYKNRKVKIGAFTACSNVTGIQTDYYQLAKIMHQHGGLCFIDFAACAPYVDIDMHPKDSLKKLDGILFSPHKFLGGPGTSGILILSKTLLKNAIPDNPGGGTVIWTDKWGDYKYASNEEEREDGGTPGFLQMIKTALTLQLKEQMGIEEMLYREKELTAFFLPQLEKIKEITILDNSPLHQRLSIIAFYAKDMHHHLFVKLLNDRFGIQARGGCSCAGPYGHYLFNIDHSYSKKMANNAEAGDMSLKPGWVRISLHPVMSNKEIAFIIMAIKEILEHKDEWRKDYQYNPQKDTFEHIRLAEVPAINMKQLFSL
ncbi:aminotransferase class V-fold PLP-dependent enzyme [Paraliobacillus sediminis]|uniref:aminotransferase class V-fold PLP-dependent enzyme n=1 Tax=Paraliobacillus sediminis TaxID=1885916 RepID=UPI000E3DDB5B|nr:aminotransferase class V-fold PLP-dependent enzyme [Paraliobacillus sediminis]